MNAIDRNKLWSVNPCSSWLDSSSVKTKVKTRESSFSKSQPKANLKAEQPKSESGFWDQIGTFFKNVFSQSVTWVRETIIKPVEKKFSRITTPAQSEPEQIVKANGFSFRVRGEPESPQQLQWIKSSLENPLFTPYLTAFSHGVGSVEQPLSFRFAKSEELQDKLIRFEGYRASDVAEAAIWAGCYVSHSNTVWLIPEANLAEITHELAHAKSDFLVQHKIGNLEDGDLSSSQTVRTYADKRLRAQKVSAYAHEGGCQEWFAESHRYFGQLANLDPCATRAIQAADDTMRKTGNLNESSKAFMNLLRGYPRA